MDKKRVTAPLKKNDLPYKLLTVFAIVAALVYRLWWVAGVLSVAFVFILAFDYVYNKRGVKQMLGYFEGFASKIKGVTTDGIAGFPFPVAVLSPKGKIIWYNRALDKIFDGELLFQKDIVSVARDFGINSEDESGQYMPCKTKVGDGVYEIWAHKVPGNADGESEKIFAYFIDITEKESIRTDYEKNSPVVALIAFDNYEEVMMGIDEENRARIASSVDKVLTSLCNDLAGILKKLERDKYLLILNKEALENLSLHKFSVLDTVREISTPSALPPTLSIGVGFEGDSLAECDSFARAAMDMALGRGGDQVVLKNKDNFRYFGGKTKEIEKRTRVKARVVAYALRELMSQSENIVLMGHKNADIDCIGACVGIVAAARARGNKANIIISECDETARAMIKKLSELPGYEGIFISSEAAREIISPRTLLVVADTHKLSYTENKNLLMLTDQIAVIDHHRRDSDFIENPALSYHEPYASSTSEMVTEMIQYMTERVTLLAPEAEALYAGIYLDTKGFTFKTGVRTLEAAAYLRRSGVDTVAVKKLFQSDFGTYMKKTELVKNAQIYKEHIAISALGEKRSQFIIAQAADELLNIAGVDTSFVLAGDNGSVVISGRSTGTMNVQVILEKLGGGGHMAVAGAQLEGVDAGEAKAKLISAIEEYLNEQ